MFSSWIKISGFNCENYANQPPRRMQRSLYVFSDLFSPTLDTASNIFIWRKALQCYFLVLKIKDAGDRIEKLEQDAFLDGRTAE